MGQGLGYDGRFGTIIDADLEKLAGWSGASFHASIHQIQGTQFSAINLKNLALVSGIEAPPSTRLFNLWIEQKIGSETNVRLGQFTAAQEFGQPECRPIRQLDLRLAVAAGAGLAQRRPGLSGSHAWSPAGIYADRPAHLARGPLQRRPCRTRCRQSGAARSLWPCLPGERSAAGDCGAGLCL